MKSLNSYKMRLALVEFVAAIVIGCGNTKADFTFGGPTNLGPVVNSQSDEQEPSISTDGLELYFMSRRPGGSGNWDIWVTRRKTTNDPWEEPVNIGPVVNSSGEEWAPCISADRLELYFEANRPEGYGDTDILVAVRETIDGPWGNPVNLGPVVNTSSRDGGPSISDDGLELYFKSNRPGRRGYEDIWVSKRPSRDEPWGSPVNLGQTVSGPDVDREPSISADGLVLYFASDRFNASRGWDCDIWLTRRKTIDSAWGESINLGLSINTIYNDDGPSVSADGRTLYFSDYYYAGQVRPGGHGGADLYEVSITPIVDFNSDGIVGAGDLCIMVNHWGEDYSLCDIGPMPWGDGIVDVEDLKVLAEHLFEEVFPIELIGYWKLDETEGDIAYNSVSDNHGVLSGNPTWQPDSGQVAGALQFDGIDDYISTDFVLNPADGLFSIFAWVKGGAAGQAILSQENGANWLMADSVNGVLKTDLKEPASAGRDPTPPGPSLISPTVVTDGDWHRVGFVRDGINRILYVDDVEVARDTAANLEAAIGGLYIGAGSGLEPVTFWAGLIDDIRIYNRAVSP